MNKIISVIAFFIATIIYYVVLVPKLTIDNINNVKKYRSLVSYFMLVIISQIAINTYLLLTKCGGNITYNLGYSFLLTFIPWVVIFGAVVVTLVLFPGFKSAFPNVIGYYMVSSIKIIM